MPGELAPRQLKRSAAAARLGTWAGAELAAVLPNPAWPWGDAEAINKASSGQAAGPASRWEQRSDSAERRRLLPSPASPASSPGRTAKPCLSLLPCPSAPVTEKMSDSRFHTQTSTFLFQLLPAAACPALRTLPRLVKVVVVQLRWFVAGLLARDPLAELQELALQGFAAGWAPTQQQLPRSTRARPPPCLGSILGWCPAEPTPQRNKVAARGEASAHCGGRRDSGDPRAVRTSHLLFCTAQGPETQCLGASTQLHPEPKVTPWAGNASVPQDASPGRAEHPAHPAALPSSPCRDPCKGAGDWLLPPAAPAGTRLRTALGWVPAVPSPSHPKPDPQGCAPRPLPSLGTRSRAAAQGAAGQLAGTWSPLDHRPLLGKRGHSSMSLNTDLGAKLGKPWPRLCFINRLIASACVIHHCHQAPPATGCGLAPVQALRTERNNETCRNPNPSP